MVMWFGSPLMTASQMAAHEGDSQPLGIAPKGGLILCLWLRLLLLLGNTAITCDAICKRTPRFGEFKELDLSSLVGGMVGEFYAIRGPEPVEFQRLCHCPIP
jgi:hypothetical protein